MAKFVLDAVLDTALNEIINNADQLVICSGQPATYADATTDDGSGGNALGETAIAGADFTGPADGDTNGRKLTVNQQTGITVDVTGTADHVAIVDDTNSRLLLVTTISSQSVSSGGTADVNAFDQEIADPS
jgi:hypothetical protein